MILDTKDFIRSNYNLELKSVPLRIWNSDWPVPKRINLQKNYGKKI